MSGDEQNREAVARPFCLKTKRVEAESRDQFRFAKQTKCTQKSLRSLRRFFCTRVEEPCESPATAWLLAWATSNFEEYQPLGLRENIPKFFVFLAII